MSPSIYHLGYTMLVTIDYIRNVINLKNLDLLELNLEICDVGNYLPLVLYHVGILQYVMLSSCLICVWIA